MIYSWVSLPFIFDFWVKWRWEIIFSCFLMSYQKKDAKQTTSDCDLSCSINISGLLNISLQQNLNSPHSHFDYIDNLLKCSSSNNCNNSNNNNKYCLLWYYRGCLSWECRLWNLMVCLLQNEVFSDSSVLQSHLQDFVFQCHLEKKKKSSSELQGKIK